jgi:2-polyprenyl-3-methyl-5-hydroxy-6-metoxy-1,4-benzoquinol methylase
MKETTDYYSQARPEVAAFVPPNIKSILDVGCGQGRFLELVKEQTGAETWGIEVVNAIAEEGINMIDKVLVGKIEEVIDIIPDGYFDCISFNDVLEHLLEPKDVLRMMSKKLSKNGVILASIPNVRYFFNLRELLFYKDWHYTDSGVLDSTHFRFFTKRSMIRMFEEAGYLVMKPYGINRIKSWKFHLFNIVTLGFFDDTKYLQFVCIGKLDE